MCISEQEFSMLWPPPASANRPMCYMEPKMIGVFVDRVLPPPFEA